MVTILFNSKIPTFETLPWYKRLFFSPKRIWFWSAVEDIVHIHPDNLEYLIAYLRSKGLQYKIAKPVRSIDVSTKK